MNVKKKTLSILCIVALIASASAVLGWSALTSNSIDVVVNPVEPSSVTLTADKTTVTAGDSITFTATLDKAIAGASVQLYFNEDAVGSPVLTNDDGVAVISYSPVNSGAFHVIAAP